MTTTRRRGGELNSARLGVLVTTVVAALLGVGCGGEVSDEEFDRKMENWTKRHPSRTAQAQAHEPGSRQPALGEPSSSSPGDSAEAASDEGSCLPSEAVDKAAKTSRMLIALEKLMEGYGPSVPVDPRPPAACLTAVARRNDPEGARVEQLLASDYSKTLQQARQNQAKVRREFDEVERPRAWTWVSAIVPGHNLEVSRGVVVSETTELMKRLAKRPELKIDSVQHCVVADAELQDEKLRVSCNGLRREVDDVFYVDVGSEAGATNGALGEVLIGDLISFSGHLFLTRERTGRGQSRWVFGQVPARTAVIASPGTCCREP